MYIEFKVDPSRQSRVEQLVLKAAKSAFILQEGRLIYQGEQSYLANHAYLIKYALGLDSEAWLRPSVCELDEPRLNWYETREDYFTYRAPWNIFRDECMMRNIPMRFIGPWNIQQSLLNKDASVEIHQYNIVEVAEVIDYLIKVGVLSRTCVMASGHDVS